MELAGELGWESGAGSVCLRRIDDTQVRRIGITVTADPAVPGGK